MIVLDASVVVELLMNSSLGAMLKRQIQAQDDAFAVPHLLDVDVASALRTLAAAGRIGTHESAQFLRALTELPAERYSHAPLLRRAWQLRHRFTANDAMYVALAEATDSVLYTCDAKLCKGHNARVVLFPR